MDNKPRTIPEAAREMNLSPTTIRAWVGQRRIGFVRLGRSIRIPAWLCTSSCAISDSWLRV